LTLNTSTGVISGTVGATATSQTFTIHITDANAVTASQSYTLTVNTAPSITPPSLPGATETGNYSQTLATSGGTTPFGLWSLSTGSLPTGLTLNTSTGVISGTVGATATSTTFTIHITDNNGVVASQTYTLTVNTAPSVTSPSTLPGATQTGNYSQTLTGSNGTTPYTWTETGSLPTGLTLSSGGVISGTVGATATSSTFTVTLTDANGVTATKMLTINVNAKPTITADTPPSGTKNSPYPGYTFVATNGTTPYTWTYTGTLPTGLSLSTAGVLSGTPTAKGTKTVTVTVTDANGVSASHSVSITIN
ncbi:MAG TPA: putative Ig domain-containing protein, partial [Acidimicrobiales bacterium]